MATITDIILSNRRQLLGEKSNISFCQEYCHFIDYNSKINMTKRDCPMQITNITLDINNMMFSKNYILNNFFITLIILEAIF